MARGRRSRQAFRCLSSSDHLAQQPRSPENSSDDHDEQDLRKVVQLLEALLLVGHRSDQLCSALRQLASREPMLLTTHIVFAATDLLRRQPIARCRRRALMLALLRHQSQRDQACQPD